MIVASGIAMLGKLLLAMPNVMLLDEATNHLDMESIESLNTALDKYPGTLVFVSHDRGFVFSLATRIIQLRSGEKPREARASPNPPRRRWSTSAAATRTTWREQARARRWPPLDGLPSPVIRLTAYALFVLGGSTKTRQSAAIETAHRMWEDYKQRRRKGA